MFHRWCLTLSLFVFIQLYRFDFMTEGIFLCLWTAVCLCKCVWFHAWFDMQVAHGCVSIYGCVCVCVHVCVSLFTECTINNISLFFTSTLIRVKYRFTFVIDIQIRLVSFRCSSQKHRLWVYVVCVDLCWVRVPLHTNVRPPASRVWPWFNLGAGVIPEIDRLGRNRGPSRRV